MILKLSRFLVILLVILVTSSSLPQHFRISFGQRVVMPMIYYSPILKDFLIGSYSAKKYSWSDRNNKEYTREETDSLLPFINYRVLLGKSIMPDSINGINIDLETMRKNNLYSRIRPRDIDVPRVKLFPLFESNPPRFKLTMPPNFSRIGDRMEFFDTATNTIEDELTQSFTTALINEGFTFPATRYFGNATTRKPFDEGYFVVDAAGKLFHIKKINGEPYCHKVTLAPEFSIKHMLVYENGLKEFYGFIISEQNEIFLLLYDDYKLQKLLVEDYDASQDQFLFRGDLFYRQVSIVKKRQVTNYVMNRNYELITAHKEDIENVYSNFFAAAHKYLFPFTLNFVTSTSKRIDFYFSNYSFPAFYFSFILSVLLFSFKRYRSRKALRKWYDFAIVLLTGVYGFVAVLIYENTDL